MPIFYNPNERLNAEVLLREGVRRGNWQAAGAACIIDRLDRILVTLAKLQADADKVER